jgi:hypothetical protein
MGKEKVDNKQNEEENGDEFVAKDFLYFIF